MSEPRYTIGDFNEIAGQAVGNGVGPDRDSWLPVNLAYLPDTPPVRPTLGGFGLVYKGRRHVFSGPQESAKTLAAYAIGIETVRQGHTIVLIDFEMGAYAARNRLRELGASHDELSNIHYVEPHDPATPERISILIALNPTIVIVDAAAGAYDLQGLDDNKRQDVERFTHLYVKGFWQAGIATILLDHVVKNAETRGKYAIGSERKTGGVDVHLGFDTILPIKRGSTGLYKIVTHKDRDGFLQRGALAELHLASDPDNHSINWEFRPAEHVEPGEVWMPTKVMQKISGLLEKEPEPVSRNQIVTQIGGRKDVAIKAIDHLVRLGYVTETPGPRQAKLIETSRPFTVLEWESQPDPSLVPTSPHLFPEQVHPLVPTSSPPYGGREQVDATQNNYLFPEKPEQVSPDYGSWIDDLEPSPNEDPPADLYDGYPETTNDDDIPF